MADIALGNITSANASLVLTVDTVIPAGVAIALPSPDYVALVLARSGLATRQGLALANGVGLIDTDYRGEILCSVINLSSSPITVRDGDRIAQLMVVPVVQAQPMPCETLDPTERGAGGFGSTGRN